jgi:hypothetical protein
LAVKKLTTTVQDYIKILSNSEALDVINNKLVKYGKLEKAYDLAAKSAFQFLKKGDEKAYDFLQAFRVLPTDLYTNTMIDPNLLREKFNSTGEQELEVLRKQFVRYLLESPIASVLFIFSLAKFADNNS